MRFSAHKGLEGSDEPRCVLEPEGVAGIVIEKQLRARHAAGQEPGVGRPGVLIQGSVGDQRGHPDICHQMARGVLSRQPSLSCEVLAVKGGGG